MHNVLFAHNGKRLAAGMQVSLFGQGNYSIGPPSQFLGFGIGSPNSFMLE
jgi:hypothetical protein